MITIQHVSLLNNSENDSTDRKRISHWSRRLASWISLILFGLFSTTFWGLSNSEKVVFAIAFGAVDVLCVRGAFSGAVFRKKYLLIRDLVWTRRIPWNSIQSVETERRNNGTVLIVNLTDGRSYPVRFAEGSMLMPASPAWLADAHMKLQRWVAQGQRNSSNGGA